MKDTLKGFDEDIINKYISGETSIVIAKKYNCSPSSIRKLLKRNDVKCRPFWGVAYTKDESFFESIDSEQSAYILGLLMADGSNSGKSIDFIQSKKDYDLVELVAKSLFLSEPYPITEREVGYFRLRASSVKMCEDAAHHGLVENKTYSANFPQMGTSLKNHFIRGYFDGDGSVFVGKNNQITISFVGYVDLLEGLRNDICLNCDVKENKMRYTTSSEKGIHQIAWSGNKQVRRIFDYLYDSSNLFGNRKYTIFKNHFEK